MNKLPQETGERTKFFVHFINRSIATKKTFEIKNNRNQSSNFNLNLCNFFREYTSLFIDSQQQILLILFDDDNDDDNYNDNKRDENSKTKQKN